MRPIRAAGLGTATLVTLLAFTPVAAGATDEGSAQTKGKTRTLTFLAEVQQLTRFPVTPGSVSQGDRVVVRSDLFDEAHNKVGETHGTCTTTRGGADEAEQCLVTYVLPDGQITTQGVYFDYIDQGPFDSAITGGTGKYEKARGSVHSETIATDPKVVRRFTIHLA
ncbi:allene oxide cyclase barrel-like domain-containing protein [Streptomyces hydrogenans]|uniref:allene oxide cyclase barrel-like domain-containing protein n=1 Tax=Streptomyces hydrogenans TaxID=1873719 RepID=UPI0036294D40